MHLQINQPSTLSVRYSALSSFEEIVKNILGTHIDVKRIPLLTRKKANIGKSTTLEWKDNVK